MNTIVYKITWVLLKTYFFVFFPKKVIGLENIPSEQCIICANHHDAIDPFLLCTTFPINTPMSFLCKKEAFEKRIVSWYLTSLNCIPVDRGHSDIMAIKTAFKRIKEGRNLVIFPEGTRVKTPFQEQAKGGASMIAIRNNLKVLPCYIDINKKIFHHCTIVIGEPINIAHSTEKGTAEEYQIGADYILKRIYQLGGIS